MALQIQNLGDWQLDHATLRLSRGTQLHRLPRLQYDLLMCLVEHAGALVSREQLIERAWQRRVVGDEVLSRQIATLRQLLGDDARAPRYIETVPKVGYRWLAPVSTAVPHDPAALLADSPLAIPNPLTGTRSGARPSWHRWTAILMLVAVGATASWLFQRREPAAPPQWTAAAFAREVPLASDPELESAPRLSRDGRWLAWARRAVEAPHAQLLLASSDGGSARALLDVDGVVTGIAFAPDASALAFIEVGAAGCRVRRYTLPQGPLHSLHACGAGRGLDWSQDGLQLVFTAAAARDTHSQPLLALPLDGGTARALTAPGAGADTEPRWSPDGKRLAFARGPSGEQQLFVAAADGSLARRLGVDDRNRITALAWSADGTQIVVAMDAAGSPALVAVDANDGARVPLGARGATALDIADPVGLVYEQRRYDANVWRVALRDGEPPRRLSASRRYDAQPALSPDGSRVAYVSSRDAVTSVWVVEADGREHRLPLDPDAIWNRPAWSPDGKQLLLTHYRDGRPRIARHTLDSGTTEFIGPNDGEASAAAYAADGSIVFLGRLDGVSRLLRLNEGAAPRMIAGTEGVVEFRLGGRWLAWLADGSDSLRMTALDGDGEVRHGARPKLDTRGAWTFAGARVAFLRSEDAGAGLWLFDPESGTEERVAAVLPATASGSSLAVEAGLRFALVARIDGLEADLVRVPPASNAVP